MRKLLSFLFVVVIFFSISSQLFAQVQTPDTELHGWVWSYTTGWIKLSSRKIGTNGLPTSQHDNAVQYGVKIDGTTGDVSGYAWSSNIGWISFNKSDLYASAGPAGSCKGPNNSTPVPPKLVSSGASYKLIGTARVVSPIQNPTLAANGNWNGCIYLDSSSMPFNTCNASFGVTFSPMANQPDTYEGSGYAWNSAGTLSGPLSCTSPLGVGGLSYISFAGTKFKSILQIAPPELQVQITGVDNWKNACKKSSPEGDPENQNIDVSYSVTPYQNTTCQLSVDGTSFPVFTPVSEYGTQSNIAFDSLSSSSTVTLSCTNSDIPDTKSSSYVLYCATCSDGLDNDSVNGIDNEDKSCRVACEPTGDYTPGAPEGGSENGCPTAGTTIKGLPVIKNN